MRAVWVAIALLVAAFVGSAAGLLSWHGGANASKAVLSGGAGFGATVLLVLALVEFVMRGKR